MIISAIPVCAQRFELGGRIGGGSFVAEEIGNAPFLYAGGEFCGFCTRRLALFAEFSHWQNLQDSRNGGIKFAEAYGGGLRIQGGTRVRPFFDVGIVGANDTFSTGLESQRSHSSVGMVLGGGAAIGLGRRAYIRPQIRAYATSGFHFAWSGSVGVGIRF